MPGSSPTEPSAVASSLDGRRFSYQCPVDGLRLRTGSYVVIGGRLGQIHALEPAPPEHSGPAARVALARGDGVMLEDARPFHDLAIEPAGDATVSAWLDGVRPRRAALDAGSLLLHPTVRFPLDAGGFDRHTFFCGQSGSGKTYALGTVLEQLLLRTSARIVVLDPNSDFVRLRELRDGVTAEVASRYREGVEGLVVRTGTAGDDRLHVRFVDCDADEQAAVLRLDPVRDREEYGALVDLLETNSERSVASTRELTELLLATEREHVRELGARLRNLGIDRWAIWSLGDSGSIQELVAPGGPRAVVVDLGSLETPGEKAIAAESVLASLWRHRAARDPVLVVIDEAHNVCPREPRDAVTALATEHAARIAAEGRKFGLYLLVSTQRPHRVDELVVSQCDNLVLMRMISASDLAYVADVLSFAPAPLLRKASEFRLGESLVAGKITSHPALVRFGPRIAEEGGADVPSTWAHEREP